MLQYAIQRKNIRLINELLKSHCIIYRYFNIIKSLIYY